MEVTGLDRPEPSVEQRLADRLTLARRRHFVGRLGELELFRSALVNRTFAVLWLYGPGGIGKTAWLEQYHRLAGEAVLPGHPACRRGAWGLATRADPKYPDVEGRRSSMFKLMQRYMRKLQIAARHDPDVVLAFREVTERVSPAQSLLPPRTLWRVFMGSRDRQALSTTPERN